MLPEQQQRILSYFIEEAKDHLNTIEQGLLNLPHTLQNPEMVNDIFRAAHSVKGGAAMLGLDSIQQTAHHLEDYFKVLQRHTLQIDQKLESLLLRVFDTLQELIEHLEQKSLKLDVANRLMLEVEPVFAAITQHLELLISGAHVSHVPLANVAIDVWSEAEVTFSLSSEEIKERDLFNDLFDPTEIEDLNILESSPALSIEELDLSDLWGDETIEAANPEELMPTPSVDDWFSLEEIFSDLEAPAIIAEIEQDEVLSQLDFAELDALLEITPVTVDATTDEFAELEALLSTEHRPVEDEFAALEALLTETPEVKSTDAAEELTSLQLNLDDELEQLIASELVEVGAASNTPPQRAITPSYHPRRAAFEQTMRVPVKQLDNVSNLVGELVVYRNSLEQDQLRLRQFLDNLLHQVHQLSDVGSRMQALYERSLLEASLLTNRPSYRPTPSSDGTNGYEQHSTGVDFDALEMDRFTSFHTISQEMIELIVRVRESSSDIEFITDETDQVARQFRQVTNQLQEGLTRSRMIPFAQIADRLPRAVRDIGLQYGKQALLQLEGRDTLIDKVILEQLYDPMTHLVNNAITHGIETPEERAGRNKPPIGQITIRAFHQGNQTVITVGDDGAGIDPERVKAKAVQKGLLTPEESKTISRLEVYNLLFHPGFSTKDQVDNFAGRGVGMDVVRTSLSDMHGAINIDSTLGLGTTFTIRLPLTLSICKALCCLSDKARIAFPMDGVEDMMDVPEAEMQLNAEGQTCVPWRDSLLPFRPLRELLPYNRQLSRGNVYGGTREDGIISLVVIRSASTLIALQVDQVLGEQEIVIKQFEGPVPKPLGVAGATVMGDGRIMPIADVLELIDLAKGRISREDSPKPWTQTTVPPSEMPSLFKIEPTVLIVDDSITVRELLSLTFNKAGYRVEQARDGQEAWDKIRDGLPCDIVFCDIEMPRMDGFELLSRMQKDPNLSHVPIAMLTSRGADRHRQMAIQLGASGYFTKPYLEEALLDAAQRMLRGEVMVAT